ncbi:MAG: helix-turn-helix domain-containing protein [Edaphobacter sp.]|uniref:helix-turn-helix domain-containing protein n=1 Tax=Edaphobacter sp. TaxID=1934404 RepID=UPI0023A77F56|nr:helix-turn-helix domain-containing protein [Edaphobacter sp.]MDE1175741.1 helix-turn-helix domain-containing protein [Edaphobacter sp.]
MADIATPPPSEMQRPARPSEAGDGLEAHVQHILQSPQFARAETQRKLLAYLWEQRRETVSEYAIATEALGRNSSFDSTVDASVRVHISRLRRKLKDYYQSEPGETEMLVIPTGTHQLMALDPLPTVEEPEEIALPVETSWTDGLRPYLLPVLAGLCLALAVTVGLLGWKYHTLQKSYAVEQPKPTTFWARFLQGEEPIKIILPTPVFFHFSGAPTFRLRSTKVNDYSHIDDDPQFRDLIKNLGTPGVEMPYTVTWDTLAAIDMARYLDSVGAKQRVSFDVSRDSSMMVLEEANVIMLGTHQTMQPFHAYLQTLNFTLSMNERWVANASPAPSEQARYDRVSVGAQRSIEPSIIALLPGRAPGLKLLLLESARTGAMVTLLSSSAGSNSIDEMWRRHGSPPFFEMVVQTEVESNKPLRSWPVAMHAYRAQAPANSM